MEDDEYELMTKHTLLEEEIIDKNYDKTEFIDFCISKKDDGDDLTNWTIPEFKALIKEFQSKNQGSQSNQEFDYIKNFNDEDNEKISDINDKNKNSDINEIKKIREELNNYKEENKRLKEELNEYKENQEKLIEELLNNNEKDNTKFENEIKSLKEENTKLKNELVKVNKIMANINNNILNQKETNNFNEINYLKEIIKSKDKEIDYLNIQLKNIQSDNKLLVDYENIIVVNFVSLDNKLNCGIKCLKSNTFSEVEEKLYQRYEEYRDTNNNFITNGNTVLRFKKICDNGIKDGDVIQLIPIV